MNASSIFFYNRKFLENIQTFKKIEFIYLSRFYFFNARVD